MGKNIYSTQALTIVVYLQYDVSFPCHNRKPIPLQWQPAKENSAMIPAAKRESINSKRPNFKRKAIDDYRKLIRKEKGNHTPPRTGFPASWPSFESPDLSPSLELDSADFSEAAL